MILILDFGSQTAHLIARRVRDMGIDVKIVSPEAPALSLKIPLKTLDYPKGIILSGGPSSVYEKNAPTIDPKLFDLGIPILGICYGQQLIGHLLPGGKTVKDKQREDGPATFIVDRPCILFEGMSPHSRVWMSHGDSVVSIPDGFEVTGHSESIAMASIKNDQKKIYGVQLHPEVVHTEHGQLVLRNFIEKVCGLTVTEHVVDIDGIVRDIKKTVGPQRVLAAVSGGVDSTVAAALVAKAVGKQLTVVYCDNGLMRLGTADEVKDIFEKKLKVDLRIVDCKELFLKIS